MSDYQRVLFNGAMVKIGAFAVRPEQANFHNTGPTGGYLIVFPRLPVQITHIGRQPVTANPNLVMFYNHGQEYRRDPLDPQGDDCQWFGFGHQTILEIVGDGLSTDERRPFKFTHGPASADSFAHQRRLFQHLNQGQQPDALFVEEMALAILTEVVRQTQAAWLGSAAYYSRKVRSTDWDASSARDAAAAVEQYLALHFQESLTLPALAARIGYSPFHLSRVFHQQTGQTIHQYLRQLRLRAAFEHLLTGEEDLTRLALDLGFAGHSHLTQAFRQTFGLTPSQVRRGSRLAVQWTANIARF